MKTKLNQVAIFSLANCERILTNNTDKSLCLKNFGEDLIRQVRKDDWSEKTTLKIREYLDNCYTSVNTMRESRRPFTSRLGEIHKRFVAQENAIDPDKPGTPAFVCKQILAERLRLEDERIADERSRNERARLRANERIERDGKLTDEARAEAIERNNLRIDLSTFRNELLAKEGLVTGRFDTRFTTYAPCTSIGGGQQIAGDASSDAVEAAWAAAFRQHLNELGYEGAPVYPLSNFMSVGLAWDRSHEVPGTGMRASAPNVAYDIAAALKHSPTVRVAVLGGRYDAATPYWNAVRDISCLFLPEELKRRVEFKLYSSGHMAYVDESTLEALGRDMTEFYAQ